MLEIFLELINSFKALINARQTYNRALFEDHINPIYTNMRAVYENYVAIFERLEDRLKDSEIPLLDIAEELEEDRREYATSRKELVVYNQELLNSLADGDLRDFCYHCITIIEQSPDSKEVTRIPRSTKATNILRLIRAWLGELGSDLAADLRQGWSPGEINIHKGWLRIDDADPEKNFRKNLAKEIFGTKAHIESHWESVMKYYHKLRVSCLKGV